VKVMLIGKERIGEDRKGGDWRGKERKGELKNETNRSTN